MGSSHQAVGRPTVVAAVADTEWSAHVRSLLDPWAVLTVVPNVRSLRDETPDVVLWHLGCAEDADDASIAALRRFRAYSARSLLVAYCRISVSVAPLLVNAGRVDIDRVLVRGYDDLRLGLRRELEDRGMEVVSRDIVARLALPEGRAWEVVAHCVRRAAATVLTVEELARDFGVSRKTLLNWLRAARLPSPQYVIGWARLLVAAALLEAPHRSIASVATRLGFTSESALRGMLVRYARLTPREMRQSDGFARLLRAFRDACDANRAMIPTECGAFPMECLVEP